MLLIGLKVKSLSSPCSKCTPHPSHSKASQSTIFPGICDSINPDSNLILILLPYFSLLWSFPAPRMPLVLSLHCTFVLANHHFWHPILNVHIQSLLLKLDRLEDSVSNPTSSCVYHSLSTGLYTWPCTTGH